jgi:hypothetical protein
MSATNPDTSSARKRVRFDSSNQLPTGTTLPAAAKLLYDGISSLHTTFHGGETVLQCNNYIALIKKLDTKAQYLTKFNDPKFVPQSLRLKTQLKSTLQVSTNDGFKSLVEEFDTARDKFISIGRSLMQKTAKLELAKLADDLVAFTAQVIFKIMIVHSGESKASREPAHLAYLLSVISVCANSSNKSDDGEAHDIQKIFFGLEHSKFASIACKLLFKNEAKSTAFDNDDASEIMFDDDDDIRDLAQTCMHTINKTIVAAINANEFEKTKAIESIEIAKLIAAQEVEKTASDAAALVDNIDINKDPTTLRMLMIDIMKTELAGKPNEGQSKSASLKNKKNSSVQKKGKEKGKSVVASSNGSKKESGKSKKPGNDRSTTATPGGRGANKNKRGGRGRGRGGRH